MCLYVQFSKHNLYGRNVDVKYPRMNILLVHLLLLVGGCLSKPSTETWFQKSFNNMQSVQSNLGKENRVEMAFKRRKIINQK